MHIVSVNPGPFEDLDDLRQYVMSDAFGRSTATVSAERRPEGRYRRDIRVLKRILSITGICHVRSELRDITLGGVDTLSIRIDRWTRWHDVETELHRVLESLKPVQV